MPDKKDRLKPHDPKARKAARERIHGPGGWFDKPEHRPTKADDEATREDALDDPTKQQEDT